MATTWLGQAAVACLPDTPLLQDLAVYLHVENPVRQFQLLYCAWLAAALILLHSSQVKFLQWFDNSGCVQRLRHTQCT